MDPVDRDDEGVLALEPGDLVFAYTDGLVEARRAGEIYGGGRLMQFLGRRASASAPAIWLGLSRRTWRTSPTGWRMAPLRSRCAGSG